MHFSHFHVNHHQSACVGDLLSLLFRQKVQSAPLITEHFLLCELDMVFIPTHENMALLHNRSIHIGMRKAIGKVRTQIGKGLKFCLGAFDHLVCLGRLGMRSTEEEDHPQKRKVKFDVFHDYESCLDC